jgi:arabinose-5-phosphate isomerase
MSILEDLHKVFDLEIATLVKTREQLDEAYEKAVRLIFGCTGKIVVTGMGKSGLIAQKIAATMVSTGTLAISLHPGDGLHGDLGIIRPGDVLLGLSKSGETEELLDVLVHVRKANIPVIMITAKPESAAARNSDVVIYTPVDIEACPLNLAPTSSTTAALVVGDALAMALMNLRGFKSDHFASIHPSGQLGKRLLIDVSDVMRVGDRNPVVEIDDPVRKTLLEITSKHSGAASVVDSEYKLAGLITDFDIRTALERGDDVLNLTNREIMNHDPTFIFSDEKAINALEIMENRERPFLVLPVLDRSTSKVVGMVHVHDLVAKGL